eukprot:COSAG01_NODE_13865_length_1525_cov_2.485975_1_plen_47_part_01
MDGVAAASDTVKVSDTRAATGRSIEMGKKEKKKSPTAPAPAPAPTPT